MNRKLSNYLEIANLDKPIYRIFPVNRFFEMIKEKKMAMVKPKLWDDPFENLLLSSRFQLDDGEIVNFESANSVYGQCWTEHRESDAMWRIYSPQKNGIRVSTTPRKLLSSLENHVGEFFSVRCFLGKVLYKKPKELLEELSKIHLLDTSGTGIAKSLLYKREAFSHEREIRLIYFGKDGECKDNIFKFDFEPNELIDRILFDPRMDKNMKNAYKYYIKILGYDFQIKKSTLYDPPEKFVFKI